MSDEQLSDKWLSRYGLGEKIYRKCDGNGNMDK